MIKTVKISKKTPIHLCTVSQSVEGAEIEYLQPGNFDIEWKASAIGAEMDLDELAFNQNVTTHKIEHFLQNYVDNSVWFEKDGLEMADRHLSATENMLIITPTLNFTILGLCLFAKLNALCKPGIVVTDLSICDLSTNQTFEYCDLDADLPEILPNQDEFMGDLTVWAEPWWMRDDVTTYDHSVSTEEEMHKIRENIKDAEESVKSDFDQIEEMVSELLGQNSPAEIIEVDFSKISNDRQKWKPKLV